MMKTYIIRLLCLSLLTATTSSAWAEKADANKQTSIDSDRAVYDSAKDAGTFSGNIVLTRGSLVMMGDKLDFAKNANGYQNFVLLGQNGKLVTFRQKSDSGDNEWLEGEGQRIEYSDQTEEMKIFSKARLKRLSGDKIVEEVEGEAIVYDSLKEFFQASNDVSGQSIAGNGRVKVVIQSREALNNSKK